MCEKKATFLDFAIFRLFPNMVYSKSIHIQEKQAINFISIKVCAFAQLDMLQQPWEFFEPSCQPVPNIQHSKSNFKQQKSAAECVSINFY